MSGLLRCRDSVPAESGARAAAGSKGGRLDGWIRDDLTIGDVSAILDIPAKMLRYWDEIGLLKPHDVNEINGYRYYSTSQFYLLNFIKYLRALDVPYDVIKARLHDTDQRYLMDLLKEQAEIAECRIRELGSIKETFLKHVSDMEAASKVTDLDRVIVSRLPARNIVRHATRIASRMDLEVSIRSLSRLIAGAPTLLVSQVGVTMAEADFMSGNYEAFSGSFVMKESFQADPAAVVELPACDYAAVRFWGNIKSSYPYYDMLADFMRERGYVAAGDMIRRCLAPGTVGDKHAHLAEVAIPVLPIGP